MSRYSIKTSIVGMTCGHCVNTVTKALQDFPGVISVTVSVNLEKEEAMFDYDDPKSTQKESDIKASLIEAIENLGYDASILEFSKTSSTISSSFLRKEEDEEIKSLRAIVEISGMTCSSCTGAISKTLQTLPFVEPASVAVSLESESATLIFNNPDDTITEELIINTIEGLGYTVEKVDLEEEGSSKGTDDLNLTRSTDISTASFSLSGMTCSHCVKTVSEALQELPEVIPESVMVSLEKRKGVFSFRGDQIDASTIKSVVEGLGYDLNGKPRFTVGINQNIPEISNSYSSQVSIQMDERTSLLSTQQSPNDKRKVVMRVIGMTCESCVKSVTDALQNELSDVQPRSVQVNLQAEMAMFICTNPDIKQIHKVIHNRGFDIENVQIIHNLIPPAVLVSQANRGPIERIERQNSTSSLRSISIDNQAVSILRKVKFQVMGMTCSSCVRTIENGLKKLPGVDPVSVQVNLLTHTGSFSVCGDVLSEQTITKAISDMGYTVKNIVFISDVSTQQETTEGSNYEAEMIITGMYCPNCVEKVHNSLIKLHGIIPKSIEINLDSGRTGFKCTGEFITRQRIYQAILQLGFSAESIKLSKLEDSDTASISSKKSNRMVSTHLTITGMTCSSCVANIERTMIKQPGVVSCQVNLLSKSAVIQHDPTVIGARSLAQMIEQIGYKAELAQDNQTNTIAEQRASMREDLDNELAELKSRFLWSLLFAIPVVLISMVFMMALPESSPLHRFFMKEITHGLSLGDLTLFLLATPVQFWLGMPFYERAYKSLVYSHTANMETLVAMGTTVAYVASVVSVVAAMVRGSAGSMSLNYFETSVLLITFINFGKWLEAMAKGKTAETITKLMDLQPEKAILVEISHTPRENSTTNDTENHTSEAEDVLTEKEIDSKDIQVGDILKVNAGGRIPCDGKIWKGASATDESMITGESIPVSKKEGESVITATINLTAPIYIRAIRVGTDTTLSRIIQLVQDAQASPKAPIEQLADNISSIFVPVVILLAFITFIVWEVLSIYDMYPDGWVPKNESKTLFSLMLAVTVLVIACPCGLGLASPTAVMVGTGVAAKYGVLVKGGGYALEMASRITTVAFDKTGTLTMGHPVVTHSWIDQSNKQQNDGNHRIAIWKILGRVSSVSSHPLSKSIERKARYIISTLMVDPNVPDDELISSNVDIAEIDDSQDNYGDSNALYDGVTITNAQEVPGRGLLATITLNQELSNNLSGKLKNVRALNVFLGNQEWMDENHAKYQNSRQAKSCHDLLTDWQNLGQSTVLIAASPVAGSDEEMSNSDVHKAGCKDACVCDVCNCATSSLCCSASQTLVISQLAIADISRPEASGLIAELRKRNIEVWMITGDNERTGRVIGKQLGIPADFVLAGVKPEQKADKIRNLQRHGIRANDLHSETNFWRKNEAKTKQAVVAMVGDGINDSPALAQADVGVSVGSATDIAIEAASIVLIRNNLMDLLTMYDLSRTVVRRIRFNFIWAFLYNTIAIPIAAGIVYPVTGQGLPPYVAGIAMIASSVSVVCSSLLLRFYKAPKVAEDSHRIRL